MTAGDLDRLSAVIDRRYSGDACFACDDRQKLKVLLLIQRQQSASAGRTDVLVMNLTLRRRESVVEAELIKHKFQIRNVHSGRVVLFASQAVGSSALPTGFPVKRNSQRQGPLHNMEKFSERQIEQETDD